jgi:hypothetical protein
MKYGIDTSAPAPTALADRHTHRFRCGCLPDLRQPQGRMIYTTIRHKLSIDAYTDYNNN